MFESSFSWSINFARMWHVLYGASIAHPPEMVHVPVDFAAEDAVWLIAAMIFHLIPAILEHRSEIGSS